MAEVKEDPTVEPTVDSTEGTTPEPVVPEPTPVDQFQGTPFAGKTPEEIGKMYADKEAFIQTQSNELGTLRNENAYHRSIQPQQQEQPKPDYEDMDQQFLTNPAKTTMNMMDERFNQFAVQSQYQTAQSQAPMARQQAMNNNKELFGALSQDQMAEIDRNMSSFLDPRNGANPSVATNPDYWRDYASVVYMRGRGNAPIKAPVNPVDPVVTETPQATKPKEGASFLSKIKPGYTEIWTNGGFTPEQQEKMAKKMLEGEK